MPTSTPDRTSYPASQPDMRRVRRAWGLLAAVLLLAGTACSYPVPGNVTALRAAEPAVTLNVVNDYGFPLRIYAVGSGMTQRLGTVSPGQEGRLILPSIMAGNDSVQLVAQTWDRGPSIHFGPMLLSPGKVVDFTISRRLSLSSAAIRAPRNEGGR